MRTERAVFLVTALLVFLVYSVTSAPGLGLVDSGELTTVAVTLSIAHPTGYPLWTILGHLWQAAIPASAARALVLFSVICGASACGVLSVMAWRILRSHVRAHEFVSATTAVLLGVTFGLSSAIWSSVAFAEVYPLTLLVAVLLLAVAASQWLDTGRSRVWSAAAVACYLWGLGFGNHLTILWFFPIVLWLAIRAVRSSLNRKRSVLLLIGLFALGASVNLFLPIRSSVHPILNWSDPQTISNLLRHLTAWQYRVWMFKGNLAGFVSRFADYLATLPGDMGWPLLLLTIIGTIRAVAKRGWFILQFLAVWLIGVGYNLNYSIPDISTYFVAFYAPLFIIAIHGFIGVVSWVSRFVHGNYRPAVRLILAILIVVTTAAPAMRSANHRHDNFATDHAVAVLNTLPDGALVFQGNWDIQSPLMYLQIVEHMRPDVVMLDLALIQRPWYVEQEKRRHPGVFAGAEREIAAFQKAVAPFESGDPYDGGAIEAAYVAMINRVIENQYHSHPVYVRDTRNVGHPEVAAKFPNFPGGYFVRVSDQRAQEPMLNPDRLLKYAPSADERQQYLFRQAAISAALQGSLAMEIGDTTRVREAAIQATELAHRDPLILRFLAQAEPYLAANSVTP